MSEDVGEMARRLGRVVVNYARYETVLGQKVNPVKEVADSLSVAPLMRGL